MDLRDDPATMDEDAAGMVEPGLHLDPSVSALDRHASRAVGGQGDRQCGELVLREGQQHGGIGVDAIREVLATSDDLGGFTEEPDGEIEGVDTEVEGHSATQRRREETVLRVIIAQGEQVPLNTCRLPDRTAVDGVDHLGDDGEESGPHPLHREDLVGPSSLGHFGRCLGGGGEGLLDQNGLACLDGSQGDRAVLRVWSCHINDVNGGVGDHFGIRVMGVGTWCAEALGDQIGEGIGARDRPRRDGGNACSRDVCEVVENRAGDASSARDSPTNGGRGVHDTTLDVGVSNTTICPDAQSIRGRRALSKGIRTAYREARGKQRS